MKKELFIHFAFWFSFFVLVILLKHYFNWSVLLFVLGGLIGIVLPDLDHLIYAYFVHPQDLSSQRIDYLVKSKDLRRGAELLYETRSERRGLIFHSILFQGLFFIVLFWVLSSSGSLLGRGVALSFALHLAVDQLIDLTEMKSLENWFTNLHFKPDPKQSKNYLIASSAVLLLMGFVM